MTERTFRSPSPARSAAPADRDVPPVPNLPKHEQYKTESTGSPHKRATSLQLQPLRTGSQRLQDGNAPWFGGPTSGDLSNVRHSDDVINAKFSFDNRPSSPSSSINFSYPRSKHESIDGLSRSEQAESDHTMVYDANSRRMVPRGELLMREAGPRDSSEKTSRRRKSERSKGGSQFAKGQVSRLKGTAVEKAPSEASTTSQVSTSVTSSPKTKRTRQALRPISEPEPYISREQTLVEETESDAEEPLKADLRKSDGATIVVPEAIPHEDMVETKPATVQQQSQSEDDNDTQQKYRTTSPSRVTHAVDAVPVKSSSPVRAETASTLSSAESSQTREPQTDQNDKSKPLENKQHDSVRRSRGHSESPNRITHFAPTTDQLLVRHEPPPRSLSPRKSALKQRSPTRDASPSETGSEFSAGGAGSTLHEDSAIRRRSVRVSFDDQNPVVLGESAPPQETESSAIHSPQSRKPWHNIIGRHKRDSTPLDDDEKMTPRPALPSFGSIREKKIRDTEERPLIRPGERTFSPQATTPPVQSSPNGKSPVGLGQSSDSAIGSVLAQEQAARNEANTSRYREPLPPVVTSVDNSDLVSSDTSLSDDDDEVNELPPPRSEPVETTFLEDPREPLDDFSTQKKDFADTQPMHGSTVPTISIIHPSPRIPEERSESPEDFFDVPGGFPEDSTPETSEGAITPTTQDNKSSIPKEDESSTPSYILKRPAAIVAPRSIESLSALPPSPGIHDIKEETEESEESSIYSDAYEDLSDMEGDGFISLAAVVDSPVDTKLSNKIFEQALALKEKGPSKETTPTKATFQDPPRTEKDWENAKAYWKSLSADKRRQLEIEAMEEEGEDADLDEAFKEKPKAVKRKSFEARPKSSDQKTAEKPVKEQSRDPERVYQIQPGTSWDEDEDVGTPPRQQKAKGGMKLRKSMRGEEPASRDEPEQTRSPNMRKSLRTGGAAPAAKPANGQLRKSLRSEAETVSTTGVGMRKSLRANGAPREEPEPRTTMRKSVRPTSHQPSPTPKPVDSHRRNQSATTAVSPQMKSSLRRRGSDSSESSFKRARPSSEGFGFRTTMRGSMRNSGAPSATASDAGRGSGRFSLRSLSPPGSRFRRDSGASPPASVRGTGMRHSLRGTSDAGSISEKRMSGFSRSSGKKAKKGRAGSRFADSSDEDDVRPTRSSRFGDSSDEDETRRSRIKSNGLPRSMRSQTAATSAAAMAATKPATRREEDESPDLPDSDDEIVQPKRGTTSNGNAGFKSGATLKRSGSGRESLGATRQAQGAENGGPRPQHTRRGSFMSILRRKKDPADKISREVSESGARRGTHLERNSEQLAVIRSNSNSNTNGRLQKRAPSWPLPEDNNVLAEEDEHDDEETYVDEEKRPSTSGGPAPPASTSKHGFMRRRSTSQLRPDDPQVGEGKKKKFGALRKMFGLHD